MITHNWDLCQGKDVFHSCNVIENLIVQDKEIDYYTHETLQHSNFEILFSLYLDLFDGIGS